VCCSVLQCVAACCSAIEWVSRHSDTKCVLQCVAVCCSVLQCVAVPISGYRDIQIPSVCCSVLQCATVCCSMLQCLCRYQVCVAVCCSVLQCVAACCSAHEWVSRHADTKWLNRTLLCIASAKSIRSLLQNNMWSLLQKSPTKRGLVFKKTERFRAYTNRCHSNTRQHTATQCNTLQHTDKSGCLLIDRCHPIAACLK